MIANFFKKSKPVNVFNTVLVLFACYVVQAGIHLNTSLTLAVFLEKLGLLFLLVFFVLVANFIIEKNGLTQDNTYGLIFVVVLFGTFPATMRNLDLILTNLFLLFALRKIYSLRSNTQTIRKLFDAGFWIGIAVLFQVWSLLFLWLVYAAMLIYKKVRVNLLFVPFIGTIIPVFLFFTFHFYFDSSEQFYTHFLLEYALDLSNYDQLSIQVPLLFYGVLLLSMLALVSPKKLRISNKIKYNWQLYINHLIISILVFALIPEKNGSESLFIIFPVAIGAANLMERWHSKIFQNILIYLAMSLLVLVYYL